ncbi:MAG: AI-2E family transporter [Bacteroidales bacterium]|nr:AI-2E family transporter [Bacteroidales bacterium]MCF8344135.1 AI-2E family transporter [Bacteroidales bacterium]MCF8350076.1 AI-2E family transporter [Bacteroidales bacterium]MCF8374980.1 AI-2E family transporter [Bacteroidales bacterium]
MLAKITTDRFYKIVVILAISLALIYVGRIIFMPIFAAIMLSVLIYPINAFFERFMHRLIATILNFIIITAFVSFVVYLLGTQIYRLFSEFENFWLQIQKIVNEVILFVENKIMHRQINIEEFTGGSDSFLKSSTKLLNTTLTTSGHLLTFFSLLIVFTFLFLLYRTSFKYFAIRNFSTGENRDKLLEVILDVSRIIRKYFLGLFFVILIVGLLNGLGLWAIGIDYPFLFGYLAALLTIIPYVGTAIGGSLPVIYALINYNSLWMPVMVLLLYLGVQALEGNVITPKVVGSQASLNPLFVIISIVIGGLIWGIVGMILFVPIIAAMKIIFDHVESLKPIGLLLSSDFSTKSLEMQEDIQNTKAHKNN